MAEDIVEILIQELGKSFRKGVFTKKTTFYFTLGDEGATATLDADTCTIVHGKTVDNPDCICQTSAEMFSKIWFDGYRPGIMDFIGGKIKTNDPFMLQQFLQAFRK